MIVNVIKGDDANIAQWAGAHLGVTFQEPYRAFGFVNKEGRVFAASVFNDFYPGGNVEWTHVGPGRFTPDMASFLCSFAFNDLKAARVTAKTRRSNAVVRKSLPRVGFSFEGVQKRYFGPEKGDDAIVYVLWPEGAKRWLNGAVQ